MREGVTENFHKGSNTRVHRKREKVLLCISPVIKEENEREI